MQDIVTKENWSSDPDNAPLPSDFNRIESNIRKVEENRQEETTARQTADTTLQNNIDSEESRALEAESAMSTLNAIGSFAFLSNYFACPQGGTVTQSYEPPYTGGLLRYAGIEYTGGVLAAGEPTPTGTWKCLGFGPPTSGGGPGCSLYVKVSN